MFFKSFLIKYGEIGIKGKNRYLFEDALVKQIRHAPVSYTHLDVYKRQQSGTGRRFFLAVYNF